MDRDIYSQIIAKIRDIGTKINAMKESVDESTGQYDSVVTRLSTAETDIDALETGLSTAETDIDALETGLSTAETDIDALEQRLSALAITKYNAGSGCNLLKMGKLRIACFTNSSATVTTDGLSLPEANVDRAVGSCVYNDGNNMVAGLIDVNGGKLYITNYNLSPVAGSYIRGQVIYYVE